MQLAGAEATHGVTRVQLPCVPLEEVSEETDCHTFGQVLAIEGYPDVFQEREQLNCISRSKLFIVGRSPRQRWTYFAIRPASPEVTSPDV